MAIRKFIIFLLLFLLFFGGCSGKKQETGSNDFNTQDFSNAVLPVAVKDLLGREILFDKFPERIISLVPSATEVIFATGAGDKLVGVTEYCTYPPEAREKEIVGGYSAETIILEKLIYLNPDLVIVGGEYHSTVISALEKSGIAAFSMDMQSIEDIYAGLAFIGFITENQDIAENRIKYMKDKEQQIRSMVSEIPENLRITVFWEVWSDPLMTAGRNSFINELIETAGGINIFSDFDTEFPVISAENVIYSNPEAIIKNSHNSTYTDDIKNRLGWDTISAVKNNRIYLLDEDIISRPGPRIIIALGLISKNLYPDFYKKYFEDQDPASW